MNIEAEIKRINERLENIESFLGMETAPEPQIIEEDSKYEVLDFKVQQADSIIGPEYAYRIKIKNISKLDLQFSGFILFFDASEFEIDRQTTDMIMVRAGQTDTLSGKATIIDENHAARIVNVGYQIWPM